MDIANQKNTQLIVGNCVACSGLVRFPVNCNPNATVKCPRCGENFQLAMVLEQTAPALEVVEIPTIDYSVGANGSRRNNAKPHPLIDEIPEQPEDRQPGDKFVVSPILSKGAKRKRRRRSRSESDQSSSRSSSRPQSNGTPTNGVDIQNRTAVNDAPETVIEDIPDLTPTPQVGTEQIAARIAESRREVEQSQVSSRPKRRRRTSSSSSSSPSRGLETAKIIFGAFLAIPVAQLLVWWAAGTDPLGIGPTVGKMAPFVVPAEFRDGYVAEDPESSEEKPASSSLSTDIDALPIPEIDPDTVRLDDDLN